MTCPGLVLLVCLRPLGVSLGCGVAWGVAPLVERRHVERHRDVQWSRAARIVWRRR